jgi:Right handed beta helix region
VLVKRFARMAAVLVAASVATFAGVAAPAHASTFVVHPGESIQAAVDAASPGDTIRVKRGVYHESVTIQKDRITLRGAGVATKIVPPDPLPDSPCTQFTGGSGVCAIAISFDPTTGDVLQQVHDVTVEHLWVAGFPAFGVFAYGADDPVFRHIRATDNEEYGIARFNSTGGAMVHNVARGAEEAGVYLGDTADAQGAVIGYNRVSGNALGVFVRHSHEVVVKHNIAVRNCQGILLLDDGQPGGAGDIRAAHNVVIANNNFCPPSDEAPPLQGGGILLLGATNSTVEKNVVLRNKGDQINSGGILVVSASPFGGGDPSGNLVRGNVAFRNQPADIIWDGSGSGNVFQHNHCRSSVPSSICS